MRLVSKSVMHKGSPPREEPEKEVADEKELFVAAAEIEPVTSFKNKRRKQ